MEPNDARIEIVSEEVPEDTPTDEEREDSEFFEEGPEISEEEAERFASVSEHPPEAIAEGEEIEHEEIRDDV